MFRKLRKLAHVSSDCTIESTTLTLDEIEELYNDLGIVEKAQQTEWSAEPNLMTYYSIPTIYAQTPLVYSDKSNV